MSYTNKHLICWGGSIGRFNWIAGILRVDFHDDKSFDIDPNELNTPQERVTR